MLNTELCKLLGVKYPIIQAGMGPFCNNNLSIAAANAGVLGLMSTSGLHEMTKQDQFKIYEHWAKTAGADPNEDKKEILRKAFQKANEGTKESGGIFGVNVMVSGIMREHAELVIETAIEARENDPSLKDRFKVIFTSAGDPLPWGKYLKEAGFTWLHVIPSVKGALRCQKAGCDLIVASGHEGGFHTSWEPVHSMTLLPAVVEALKDSGIPVAGAGGFCDGKTLAAALALGGAGVQMGTRFLATQESDFADLWKQGVVNAGDRGTLVARGFVGPARWIKTPISLEHQVNTLKKAPGVFLGMPDDPRSKESMELMDYERKGINATYDGDEENALYAGGECAQRIDNMPTVKEMVEDTVAEAKEIISGFPTRYL